MINDDVSAGRLNQSEADQNTSIKLPEDYNITNVNDETLGLPLNPSINIKNEKKHNGSVNSF